MAEEKKTTDNEPGIYRWLIRAMLEAFDAEAEEAKQAIEFWSTRPPIGDKELDERSRKGDQELVNLNLEALRKFETAKGLLAPVESQMPSHHVVEAYLAVLKGLEHEVRDYRMRMARLIPEYEKTLEKWETDLRLLLLGAGELEQALGKARACAEDLLRVTQQRRDGKKGADE